MDIRIDFFFSFGRCYNANDDHEAALNKEIDAKAMLAKRLEDFFTNEHVKSSSPSSWGGVGISSVVKNMQAQLEAFDQAFYIYDTKHIHTSRQ